MSKKKEESDMTECESCKKKIKKKGTEVGTIFVQGEFHDYCRKCFYDQVRKDGEDDGS